LIPFTQYLRPHGKKKETQISRDPEIEDKARVLLELGCAFECEVLVTGEVSLTCEDASEQTLSIEVVPNGPQVPGAVDRLVCDAWAKLAGVEVGQ
jgi:hypothetical protein